MSAAIMAVALMPGLARAETVLERGAYLVEGLAGCGNCHSPMGPEGFLAGQELSGRLVEDNAAFTAWAPNITPGSRVAGWTDAELARAIREGLRPDGSLIGPPMPIALYRGLSDADLAAMVAHLRQVPAVTNEVPASTYRIPLPPSWGPAVASVPEVPRADPVTYGAYLAGPVAHCMDCHTRRLPDGQPDLANAGAGGMAFAGPWGVSVSSNLTPHEDGLKARSDAEIARMISAGQRPDGDAMLPPMGYGFYAKARPEDVQAIIAYLRSLPPRPDPR